jgi:hypothetical protein
MAPLVYETENMTPETEERIAHQLTTLNELVKHLATKEELQKLRVEMILWIIGTNLAVGAALGSAMMFYLNSRLAPIETQLNLILQHWKP